MNQENAVDFANNQNKTKSNNNNNKNIFKIKTKKLSLLKYNNLRICEKNY